MRNAVCGSRIENDVGRSAGRSARNSKNNGCVTDSIRHKTGRLIIQSLFLCFFICIPLSASRLPQAANRPNQAPNGSLPLS